MASGTLALLKYLVIYMDLQQGSGPDREQIPVQWGEIPSVHSFVLPSPPDARARTREAQARYWEALARPLKAKSRP